MGNRSKNYLRLAIYFLEKVAKKESRLKEKVTKIIVELEKIKNE